MLTGQLTPEQRCDEIEMRYFERNAGCYEANELEVAKETLCRLRVSQAELARQCRMTTSLVSHILNGRRRRDSIVARVLNTIKRMESGQLEYITCPNAGKQYKKSIKAIGRQ